MCMFIRLLYARDWKMARNNFFCKIVNGKGLISRDVALEGKKDCLITAGRKKDYEAQKWGRHKRYHGY